MLPTLPYSPGEHLHLARGDRVGSYIVVSSKNERLVLRRRIATAVPKVIAGALLAGWGILPWLALLQHTAQSIPHVALILMPGGVGLILSAAHKLTLRHCFDGVENRLVRSSRLGGREIIPQGAMISIQLAFVPDARGRPQTAQLAIKRVAIGSIGDQIPIGARGIAKRDAIHLVIAATELTRLLQIPLHIHGECSPARPALQQALAAAQRMTAEH